MPTIRFSRPFSSGSRPTPDVYDHFLDSNGFYRKHTARDASNLFRVISEQLYDTQDHHQQVRKDCVNFMIKHRAQYEKLVTGDFDEYVKTMAKAETLGTLTELRAMGYLFKRNIMLFRPKQLGKMLIDETDYRDQAPLRVFHGNIHFDSVFEKSYVIDAAFCQSLVYEMLYKKVFKLPDIEYSVETMLYSDINPEENKHEYENDDDYATHIVFKDGRKFELDRPENTHCILTEKERCHFHNKDFEEYIKRYDPRHFEKVTLSDKFSSCIRQLLFDGITPFPYKVAKSLDQNIYRNVEFDSWSEERKIMKQKQYYKVGVECLVKVMKDDHKDELLKCQIQAKMRDDTFIVYIEKLAEKRLVPWSHLRPIRSLSPSSPLSRDFFPIHNNRTYGSGQSYMNRYGYNLHGNTKSRTTRQRIDSNNFTTFGFPYNRDAICNSGFDFEPYINLSNFTLNNNTSNAHREIIAYPIYSQTGQNMNSNNSNSNSSNGGNSTGHSKSMKNRQSNNAQQQHQSNDGESKVIVLKNDTDNGNGNSNGGGGSGGSAAGQQYGKNSHESKNDSQLSGTSSASTTSHQHTYHHQQQHQQQQQHQLSEAVTGETSSVVPAPMSNYYHQGSVATTAASAPVYYYHPTATDDQNGIYSTSDMVVHPGVYTVPAAAYQSTTATTAIPPSMQPGMYAPASHAAHYPIPMNGYMPAYQPMNAQGYVFSAAPHYVPAIPAPMSAPLVLPFLSRDLLRSNGRPNYNSNYSYQPSGDDLPMNDKVSIRFFYNLGIEYFKYLKDNQGYGSVMAMIDGDNVTVSSAGYEQSPSVASDVDTTSQHQLNNDFQQFNLDTPEIEAAASPSKQRSSYNNNNNYQRYGSTRYSKRNDNRGMTGAKHFQGTYQGPARNFMKGPSKYGGQSGTTGANNGNGNGNSYESTPMKDNGTKMQQQQHGGGNGGHSMAKREQQQQSQQQQHSNVEAEQVVTGMQFGSHVPPFPFNEPSDAISYPGYGPPPTNVAYSRVTPPTGSRPSSVPGSYYHNNHNNHQVHGVSQSCWLQNAPPPGFHQSQMQSSHSTQPNQSHSLNTSSASNPSL